VRFDRIETIGFYYGLRHVIEMDFRAPLLSAIRAMNVDWSARLGDDHVTALGVLGHIVGGMCETDYSGYTD
jgi:7-cyano-7-deazaguanine synthase